MAFSHAWPTILYGSIQDSNTTKENTNNIANVYLPNYIMCPVSATIKPIIYKLRAIYAMSRNFITKNSG